MSSVLRIAVIGAGISGLAAAKNAIQQGFKVTVFEQTEAIGGIWWYTDRTGKDQYGVPVHSAMYKGLRTNQPYQLMEFPDHTFPEGTHAYPTSDVVLKFIHSFVDKFSLRDHIKLNHLIVRCAPIENNRWEVIVKDLPNNRFETIVFDAVMVCNGHHVTPRLPQYAEGSPFKGRMMHSHDYRTAEEFQGESVLIVGGGASAFDLVGAIAKFANRVTSSQHKKPHETPDELAKRQSLVEANVTLQEDVKRLTETGAEFIDGTHQTFSIIVYGTGYNFTFPFLTVDTAITVDDNFVQPLYKQIINIAHPTMAFVGIPFHLVTTLGYDLQARFALKFLSGEKTLPPKEKMLMDMRANTQVHWNKGYRKHQTHFLGPEQKEYFRQLAEATGLETVPDVLAAMHYDSRQTMNKDPLNFRKYRYNIVDEKTFTKERYID